MSTRGRKTIEHERGVCTCWLCQDDEASDLDDEVCDSGRESYDESDELNAGEGADTWFCFGCGRAERHCKC